MRRFLGITFLFLVFYTVSFGQSASPFRQFYFNPYLSNPAFTGINGSPEVYLVYRKQWLNIKDAPTTMGVSFQYPTKKKVMLGLNIVTDEVVALRNTSVLATFVYALPLTPTQTLRFGLSGGVGANNLNLKEGEYDPNDPRIINAAQNNFYVDGNFGAVYTNKGFRLGFAFTQLFDGNRFSSQSLGEVKVSSLNNRFYSIGYKFPVGNSIAIEPYFLYRERADKQNSWEAASIVYIKEKLWLGASYHQTNGLGFFFGLSIKDLFKFGYSYELPPVNNALPGTSSHELQLSLRIGKKRAPLAKKAPHQTLPPPVVTSITQPVPKPENATELEKPIDERDQAKKEKQNNADPSEQLPMESEEETPILRKNNETSINPTPSTNRRDSDDIKPTEIKPIKSQSKPPRSFAIAKGNYVVAGAFKVMQNAMRYSQDLNLKGYLDVTVAINPKNNLYYVYIFSSYDIEEARKVRNQYKLKRPFSEVWLFTAE